VSYAKVVLSMGIGKSIGSFIGGITNNPGAVAILIGIGALALFRGDIRNAFGSIGESLGNIGNIQLPNIQLPEITFPTINLPEFNFEFPDVIGGAGEALGGAGEAIGEAFGGAGEALGGAGEGVSGFFGQQYP